MIPAYGLGAIVFSDFNGDGKLDVASGDGYGDGILLLGNGNGTFQSFMTLALVVSELLSAISTLTASPTSRSAGLLSC